MAARDEQQQDRVVSDSAAPNDSQTGRAVSLARLLHRESSLLLQLWKERESFFVGHTPDGGRIVSLSHQTEEPSTEQQVQLLHGALRQCLGLIHCVILKEDQEWGEQEGDYETMRETVRVRLEHLLHTTKDLADTEETLDVTPDHQCSEETDGAGGAFGLKLWTYRVLQEIIHWADEAALTLHLLHQKREGTEDI